MNTLVDLVQAPLNPNIPELSPGDSVSVSVKIKEGDRERIQEFKGTLIAVRKKGGHETFTVRRIASNGIGVELNAGVAVRTREIVAEALNPSGVAVEIVEGDSTALNYERLLSERGIEQVQLLLMHPPYHDIIQFSDDARDLSNADTVDGFVSQFLRVVERTYPILEKGRYLAIVIGDKYVKGEWIPLGFHLMQAVQAQGYKLKSIVVKNFDETRAKREQKALWRYRALAGGFYIFKHEYILVFKK